MAFKFTILLLVIVIVDNSVSPPTIEEAIERSFSFCVDYYKKNDAFNEHQQKHPADYPPDGIRYIRESDFLDFMSEDDEVRKVNSQCVNDYWDENQVTPEIRENIIVEKFAELVKWICSNQQINIIEFLEKRIAAAKLLIDKAIERSFSFCVDYYKNNYAINEHRQSQHTDYPPYGIRYIWKYDFLDFMGVDDEVRKVYESCINDYWDKNPVTPQVQGMIIFERFAELVKWICSNQQINIIKFLEKRMAAAEVIKKAFDYIYNSSDHEPKQGRTILPSEFYHFVGNDNDYVWAVSYVLPLRRNEIYMKYFKEILYLFFSNQECVIKDFLEKRIAVAEKEEERRNLREKKNNERKKK